MQALITTNNPFRLISTKLLSCFSSEGLDVIGVHGAPGAARISIPSVHSGADLDIIAVNTVARYLHVIDAGLPDQLYLASIRPEAEISGCRGCLNIRAAR